MKKLLSLILTIGFWMAGANATVAEADSAYVQDDFARAAALYQQAIDSLGPSAERYYNLGNSYYRTGKLGQAIISYERALRMDPSNQDIKDNLEYVNTKITDKPSVNESLVSEAMDTASQSLHPNSWAWIALATFILALAGVCLYFFVDSVKLRKLGFFGAGVLLILCILANIFAYRGARKATATNTAVIVTPSVILSTTPRQPKDRTEEAMLLHEGTKVEILDSISGQKEKEMWYDVKVDDTHRAWISSEAIEIIEMTDI